MASSLPLMPWHDYQLFLSGGSSWAKNGGSTAGAGFLNVFRAGIFSPMLIGILQGELLPVAAKEDSAVIKGVAASSNDRWLEIERMKLRESKY